MTGFTRKLITGHPRAIQYAKSLVMDPALMFDINGSKVYIRLEAETCQQSSDAEVSEQLLVTSEGKKYISDNIAPGPWTWTISGYLSEPDVLEVSNLFMPGLRFIIEILKQAYREGRLGFFKDPDCWPYNNVIIQSLTFDTQKDCRNKKPFQMVLKQVEVLETQSGGITRLESMSEPEAGTAGGETTNVGQGTATPISNKTIAKAGLDGEIEIINNFLK